MTPGIDRPLTLLLGALGGEGGGLMSDWIVAACEHAGYLVQSTSIPGVAQRTGATTYYIEMMKLNGRSKADPVFGLYPAPGHVDVVMTTELVEAGRAAQMGMVSPDRTTLISSSHRVLSIGERAAMGDGEFASGNILKTLNALAKQPLLRDFAALAATQGVAMNAILLGVLAASGAVPIPKDAFLHAIKTRAVAVENNLRGFDVGTGVAGKAAAEVPDEPGTEPASAPGFTAELASYPDVLVEMIAPGVARVCDYHDEAYARLYLERVARIYDVDCKSRGKRQGFGVTLATARFLALWMTYEDVIRVADLKSRADRIAKIRGEAGALPDEPVQISEYLKPGLEEATTLLPKWLGGALLRWAHRRGLAGKLHVPLRLRTDSILGFAMLRLLARLKFLRARGYRHAIEQAAIEKWLAAVISATQKNYALGAAIAGLGRLIKGYSDTRIRAFANFELIFAEIVAPALSGEMTARKAAVAINTALEAALADEDGIALNEFLHGGMKPAQKTIRRAVQPKQQVAE